MAMVTTANIIIATKRFMALLEIVCDINDSGAMCLPQEYSRLNIAEFPESYGAVSVDWTLMLAGSISKWMSHSLGTGRPSCLAGENFQCCAACRARSAKN